ncbi:MAG: hypothetical protein Q8L14_34290 [Myxococcales bacterium]|nr:hypothetical protein [Myxococcales bacterium]
MNVRSLTLGVFLFASVSSADVPPPDTSGCTNKKAGDACQTDDKKAGGCKAATCSRVDATQTPPKAVEYACVTCDVAAKPAGGCQAMPMLSVLALVPVVRRRRRTDTSSS